MERLTERTNKWFPHLVGKDVCYSHISYDCPGKEGLYLLEKALERLAQYEDLEENGLLLRLPCKIGTLVYVDCATLPTNEMEYEQEEIPLYLPAKVVRR